jgi:hypothetical protein
VPLKRAGSLGRRATTRVAKSATSPVWDVAVPVTTYSISV